MVVVGMVENGCRVDKAKKAWRFWGVIRYVVSMPVKVAVGMCSESGPV